MSSGHQGQVDEPFHEPESLDFGHDYDPADIPPDLSPRSRRIPAGKVLIMMLVGLSLGALFNADRMVARAEEKSFDDPWRDESIWLWSRAQDVAELFRVDVPRARIEEAIGRDESELEQLDIQEVAAVVASDVPEAEDVDYGPPEVVAPTAADPLRFWVGGDSMTETFGSSMQRIVGETGIIDATLDYRLSTGLTRPDFFNWPAHFVENILPTDPEVMVVMFGANDSQGIELEDGGVCMRFERCWKTEYQSRVAATMDLLHDGEDNDRIVLWVGQPIMGPASGVYGMENLNSIYAEEAAERDWVYFFDSWPFFADEYGNYADYLPAVDGTEQAMRQADTVHFSTIGGDRLSWEVLGRLGELIDMSASTAVAPRSTKAPDSVEQRQEMPPFTYGVID